MSEMTIRTQPKIRKSPAASTNRARTTPITSTARLATMLIALRICPVSRTLSKPPVGDQFGPSVTLVSRRRLRPRPAGSPRGRPEGTKLTMQRFAIVGAGFIGSVHAANLAAHPDVDFALIYD